MRLAMWVAEQVQVAIQPWVDLNSVPLQTMRDEALLPPASRFKDDFLLALVNVLEVLL